MINPIYRFWLSPEKETYINFTSGDYRLSVSTGAQIAASGYKSTMNIARSFYPEGKIFIQNIVVICFYNADGFISGMTYNGEDAFIDVPDGTTYFRFTTYVEDQDRYVLRGFYAASPLYADDLAKQYELETDQRFFRTKLSEQLSFIRQDYDYLAGQAFEDQIDCVMERSNDLGQTWVVDIRAKFMKTDCNWNEYDKVCSVQPTIQDQYTDILAGIEKEYDLIQLSPKIVRCEIDKRPLIQLYVPGDNVVTCITAGTSWEQDAQIVTNRNQLTSVYKFALVNMLKEINVTVNGSPSNASSLYVGRIAIDGNAFSGNLYPSTSNGYYLRVEQNPPQSGPPIILGQILCELRRSSDDVALFRYTLNYSQTPVWDNLDFTMTAVSGSGASGDAMAEMATYYVYGRYLVDVEEINGVATSPIPADDIVGNNRNYNYAIGYLADVAYISNNLSDTPTEYGRSDNGRYFMPPATLLGREFFPIARSTWRYASLWFAYDLNDYIYEQMARKSFILKDTFPLSSVISTLLAEVAPGIRHEATAEYSQFLYGSRNPIAGDVFTLLMSPKSNLSRGGYQQPAQKAPITLQQVMNMLRDCFRCYWYIDGNRLRIEHVEFFRNGGSYDLNLQYTADLTALLNIRNNKPWGFNSSAWQFDKVDMPERFEFSWMDEATRNFDGYPIEIISKYVMPGKIENVNIANFTSDIDYILMNPTDVSDDGFALLAVIRNTGNLFNLNTATSGSYVNPNTGELIVGGSQYNASDFIPVQAGYQYLMTFRWFVAFYDADRNYLSGISLPQQLNEIITAPEGAAFMRATILTTYLPNFSVVEDTYHTRYVTRPGSRYQMQNGVLSWQYLQPTFYVFDLPARYALINNEEVTAIGIDRKKKQTVSYPSLTDPDPQKLVKTFIGDGQIDNISITLHSRMNNITLKYDTE